MKSIKQKIHLERLAVLRTGIPMKEETKTKISLANKGKKYHLGYFHNEECKRKISIANTGKIRTREYRLMASLNAKKGKDSHLWKGGISRVSSLVRSCSNYKLWRSFVFKRDNYTCVLCGHVSNGDIHADHIKPVSLILQENNIKNINEIISNKELWDPNNGRTLCVPCHKKTDTWCNNKISCQE